MTNESVTVEELIGHRDFVRRLARSLVRDPETAEDVAQQAYAAALANPPRSRAAATGWLASVVRRLSARNHRDRYARDRREAAAARPEELPSTSAVLEREEVRRRLVRAVLALEEPYRSVVLLLEIDSANAAADFGTADLTIEGPPKTPIWVLPAGDAGELARLLAGRAVFLDLPESGKVRLAPLPRGRWLVGVDETTGGAADRLGERTVKVNGTGGPATLSE